MKAGRSHGKENARLFWRMTPSCPAMMRVEIQLGRRAIEAEDKFPTTKKLLRHFLRRAPNLMLDQITRVICSQPFVSRAELERKITDSGFSASTRQRMLRFAQILEQSPDAAAGFQQMEKELAQSGHSVRKGMERLLSAYYLLRTAPVPQELAPYGLYSLPQITAMACLGQKRMPAAN